MINTFQTESPPKKTNDFRTKYKTEKCRYLIQQGYCPFSDRVNIDQKQCTFAHSELEIREKAHLSQKYKTKPCLNFSLKGFCKYGDRCHYQHLDPAHSVHEDPEQGGRTTRSNSEESDCSSTSKTDKSKHCWLRMTHNKRIELIQSLGYDYSIRHSSRLLQLLHSTENNRQEHDWLFEDPVAIPQPSIKKYSL